MFIALTNTAVTIAKIITTRPIILKYFGNKAACFLFILLSILTSLLFLMTNILYIFKSPKLFSLYIKAPNSGFCASAA
jgi:hypothetical protein